MHSKAIIYIIALLTGLVTGPMASAGADSAQPVEQCAASPDFEIGGPAWLTDIAKPSPTVSAAKAVPKATPAAAADAAKSCKTSTPVKRKDKSHE